MCSFIAISFHKERVMKMRLRDSQHEEFRLGGPYTQNPKFAGDIKEAKFPSESGLLGWSPVRVSWTASVITMRRIEGNKIRSYVILVKHVTRGENPTLSAKLSRLSIAAGGDFSWSQ